MTKREHENLKSTYKAVLLPDQRDLQINKKKKRNKNEKGEKTRNRLKR